MITHRRNVAVVAAAARSSSSPRVAGFTLMELLIATVVTLILTGLVVQMFAVMSEGVFNSRANIELNDQLRNAKHQLIQDLRGVTAPTVPPLDPSAGMGYFEYVEGAIVANTIGGDVGPGTVTSTGTVHTVNTVRGDLDDILMFTSFGLDGMFVGKAGAGTTLTTTNSSRGTNSRFAEIAWHARIAPGLQFGNLYRRVWLVNAFTSYGSTYAAADQSMRQSRGMYEPIRNPQGLTLTGKSVVNSLGDLTMRERRSLHQQFQWPYEMMYVKSDANGGGLAVVGMASSTFTGPGPLLSLPTLQNQTHSSFTGPMTEKWGSTIAEPIPKWRRKSGVEGDFTTSTLGTGTREAEDLILTNVVGFDVKAWDPGAPVFRATPATSTTSATSDPNVIGLLVPGDPGYGGDGKKYGSITHPKGALQRFIDSYRDGGTLDSTTQPVAFGAYADLNYMWINRAGGAANVTGTDSRMNQYLQALRKYEKSVGQGSRKFPRPSFAFGLPGRPLSGYTDHTDRQFPAVWDTWSRHYEYDGIDNDGDGQIDEGTNGIDDNGNGYVDEPPVAIDLNGDGDIDANEMIAAELNGERDAPPPFDAPLRGIRVSIRVMEQDSRMVREVSTVHEFIPF